MPICLTCKSSFEIIEDDLLFIDKISPVFNGQKYSIAKPTLCSTCRQRRRLAFVNIQNLYQRKEKDTGKTLISPFFPEQDLNVVSHKRWYSDEIDGREYGREINFNEPFFEQFQKLQQVAPRWDRITIMCENCDWCFNISSSKDCYLLRGSSDCEKCMYSNHVSNSRNIIDSFWVEDSENCYELFNSQNCFEVFWAEKAKACNRSLFLFDCENVQNCIGCIGLRHCKNYFLNKQVALEEFTKFWDRMLADTKFKEEVSNQFSELKANFPRRAYNIINSEDCTGDEIINSHHVLYSFKIRDSEDSKFLDLADRAKDCLDVSRPTIQELCYEVSSCYKLYNCRFCYNSLELNNCDYCETCAHLDDCFACVGLKKAQYCIFNKQYSKEEYLSLVPKIIEYMNKDSLYGEFFPKTISFFGYNQTVAQEYFPLTRDDAINQGWKWNDYKAPAPKVEKVIKASSELPWQFAEQFADDILNYAIECEETGRPFTMQKLELEFCRANHIPIPSLHPDVRYQKRVKLNNPNKLWHRNCDNIGCKNEFKTTYAPGRPEKIYCEKCYQENIY